MRTARLAGHGSTRSRRASKRAGAGAAAATARGRTAWLEMGGIECMAHIGLEEEERSRPQRVVVDLALEGAPAGSRDGELGRALRLEVRRFLAGGRFVLVETTVLKLARLVFEHAHARRVRVRFHKFVLPGTDHVAIEMTFRSGETR